MAKEKIRYPGQKCEPAQDVDINYTIISGPEGPPGPAGTGESAYQVAVRNGFIGSEAQWLASLRGPAGADGQDGNDGSGQGGRTVNVFRYYEVTIANPRPAKPTGGSFSNPIPAGWYDTVPTPVLGQSLFMSTRIFTSDGLPPQQVEWSTPTYIGDTEFVDFEFSMNPSNPGNPTDNPGNWENGPLPGAIWMAVRNKIAGNWTGWTITRIAGEIGETGPPGAPGTPEETRYAVGGSFTVAPPLAVNDRVPAGWSTNPPNPGDITAGFYVWQTKALYDPNDNTLLTPWNTPVRVTGTPGSPGTSRSTLTSTVFRYYLPTEVAPAPPKPVGGDYDHPVPPLWYDTIPPTVTGQALFLSSRIFTSDGAFPEQPDWSTPTYVGDTEFVDFEFSLIELNPGNPTDDPGNWANGPVPGAVWMAVRNKVGGIWGPWTITHIKGEKGEKGDPGSGIQFKGDVPTILDLPSSPAIGDAYVVLADGLLYYYDGTGWQNTVWVGPKGDDGAQGPTGPAGEKTEFRYSVNSSATTPPALNVTEDFPSLWTTFIPVVGANQFLWMTSARKTATGSLIGAWSNPTRVTGTQGAGFQIQYAAVEPSENPSTLPEARWTNSVPVLSNTQSLWVRMRTVNSDGSTSAWSTPVRMSGDDGTGTYGPSMAYRGDYSSLKEYQGNQFVVDVVKYALNGKGYIARPDAGVIPVGTLPTNTTYWNEFTDDIDSLFVDFLFAYSGYISNLTVGQIQTATEMERTTIGFQPPSMSSDPTRAWSKHGIRQYWPSGHIMAYMGYVPSYVNEDISVTDSWAIIVWKPDGTPFFSLDSSSTGGPVYNVIVNPLWTPVGPGSHRSTLPKASSLTDLESYFGKYSTIEFSNRWCGAYNGSTLDGEIGLKGDNVTYYNRTPASGEPDQRQRYVTSNGGSTPVTDGWYACLDTWFTLNTNSKTTLFANVDITLPVRYIESGYVVDTQYLSISNQEVRSDTFTACSGYILTYII